MPVYDAFISYSHAKDKPVAAALQSVVQRLGKAWYRRRALRVFRDDTSLSATPHLWPSIEQALSQSNHLILLASPEAAASPWIGKEVDYWLAHKSPNTLFIGLTDGDLAWDGKTGDFGWSASTPLPQALKGRFADEPKWVDLRPHRDSANSRDARFIELGADFAAAIHGMPKEDLLSQEVRQQRRALTLAMSAAGGLFVLAVLAAWQWQEAVAQRDRAEDALATATKGTNTLVMDVAIKFRNIAGVPIDTISGVLDRTLELQQQLAPLAGGREDVLRSEALARRELATTVAMQGALEEALRYAEAAHEIMQRLVDADPTNPKLQRELSLSLNRVGEAFDKVGRREDALDAFRKALSIRQALAEGGDLAAQRDLALSHERVADALAALKQSDEAAAEYEAALEIRRKLVAAEPENAEWQLDLAVSHDKKGILLAAERPDDALAEYKSALAIRETVLASEPNSVRCQRDLSSSYVRLGKLLLKAGRHDAAAEAFRKSIPLREKLAEDRNNVPAQLDLVVALVGAADAGDEPRARISQAREIVERLDDEGKLPPSRKGWVAELQAWLDTLPP